MHHSQNGIKECKRTFYTTQPHFYNHKKTSYMPGGEEDGAKHVTYNPGQKKAVKDSNKTFL